MSIQCIEARKSKNTDHFIFQGHYKFKRENIPQIIINFGLFLKENNYFEEAFKAYEKGIALFKWPNVFDIWNTYLTEFLQR